MRPLLRGAISPDVDCLQEYRTQPGSSWSVFVELLVGPAGGEGEESFGVNVCSPQWLAAKIEREGPLILRHYIVVSEFSWPTIEEAVERVLASIVADTWAEIAHEVARIGHWEFEDYQP